MKSFIYSLIIFLCLGCSIKKTSYKRSKILKKQNSGFRVFIKGEKVNFKNYFFSKEKIKYVLEDKKEKVIKLFFNNDANELLSLDKIVKKKYNLNEIKKLKIIIDGLLYKGNEISDIFFEEAIIKDLELIDVNEMKNNTVFIHDELILIIVIEKE